jgi:histidine ammonia-lyase
VFEPLALKDLMKRSEQLGNVFGMAYMGEISGADLEDYLNNSEIRSSFIEAFTAASAVVGADKSMKKAVRSGRIAAEAHLYVRNVTSRERLIWRTGRSRRCVTC